MGRNRRAEARPTADLIKCSRHAGISLSEFIRRSLEKDIQHDPAADAKAFFERLTPLESFACTDPEIYVRELRSTIR